MRWVDELKIKFSADLTNGDDIEPFLPFNNYNAVPIDAYTVATIVQTIHWGIFNWPDPQACINKLNISLQKAHWHPDVCKEIGNGTNYYVLST